MEESHAKELGLCDYCAKNIASASKEKWYVTILKLPFVFLRKLVYLAGATVFLTFIFVAVLCLITALGYTATRYEVLETTSEDGQVVYQHDDKQTTDIINYITGKSPRPAEWANRSLPLNCPYDEKNYRMIWEIEKIAGNPRVRFMTDESAPGKRTAPAHYYAINHTMYTKQPAFFGDIISISNFIAEASHGLQFHENPIGFMFMGFRDELTVIARTTLEAIDSIGEIYTTHKDKMYNISGTLENEAHDTVEPELKKYIRFP